jgi:hypothetical protein
VPPETPDVPLRVGLEHRGGAAPDLVEVEHLPGGVVQERHRRSGHEEVVMVLGAPEEGRAVGDSVADLEPDPVDEESPHRHRLKSRTVVRAAGCGRGHEEALDST